MQKHYSKKLLLFLFATLFCLSNQVQAWEYPNEQIQRLPYEEGMGTKENPYIITSAQQLADLAYYVNTGASYTGQYFALGKDIDLNPGYTFGKDGSISGGENPKEWTPIGLPGYVFRGHFDGKGHKISGLYFKTLQRCKSSLYTYSAYTGLFGKTERSNFSNITITNSLINVELPDNYDTDVYIAYIAAILIGGDTIANCTNDSPILLDTRNNFNYYTYVAGLIAEWQERSGNSNIYEIYNCHNTGDITVKSNVSADFYLSNTAGICAMVNINANVTDCSNAGNIYAPYSVGGIFAQAAFCYENTTYNKLNNSGDITSEAGSAGGLMSQGGPNYLINSINTGKVKTNSNNFTGGLIGHANINTVRNCVNEGEVINGSGFFDYCNYIGAIYDSHNSGNITGGCGMVNGGGPYPVTIENCYNTGNVTGGNAGIIGYGGDGSDIGGDNIGLVLKNCYNTGNIDATECYRNVSGGLAGGLEEFDGTVLFMENCYNEGDITGAGYIGGLCGRNSRGKITNCYNKGKIIATAAKSDLGAYYCYAGGLSGYSYENIFSDSYNSGTVIIESENGKDLFYSGGLISTGLSTTIERCFNTADVISTGDNAGGLVGSFGTGTITNAYNTGNVGGANNVAGIVGSTVGNITLKYVYNTGNVNGSGNMISCFLSPSYSGGLYNGPTVCEACYYLPTEGLDAVGGSYDDDVTGIIESKTAEEFASGKVCILLNDEQDPTPWGQTPGTDPTPLLNGEGNPIISAIKQTTTEQNFEIQCNGNTLIVTGDFDEVEIYTINGSKITCSDNAAFDTSTLNKGVYCIVIRKGTTQATRKFVVK